MSEPSTEDATNTVTISLDLDRLMQRSADPDALMDAIVDRAALQLFEKSVARRRRIYSDDGEIVEYVAGQEFRERVQRVTDDEIRAQVAPIVTETINAGTTGRRNADGSPQTLADLIDVRIKEAFTKDVGDSFRGSKKGTLVEQVINAAIDRKLTAEWQTAINAGKDQIKDALQANAAKLLAETIAKSS